MTSTSAKIKMVIGLGNPGKAYENTRHNVGYRVLSVLGTRKPEGVLLFQPDSFMNESGHSVFEKARQKGYSPQELLVVCDDFALPLGTLRLRLKGSSGGHNGLDSILQTFGTQEVPRLRVGIGPVPDGKDPADFVLDRFTREENKALEPLIERSADAVREIIETGLESAMNRFNQKGIE